MIRALCSLLVAIAWPGWSATLPSDASAITGVAVADNVVVAGGGTTVALNEQTGTERWRTVESFAILPIGDDVALGQPGGRVELVEARSGDVRWSASVCPATSYATALRVSGDGVIAGCSGGRIARIDLHKGRVTAESDVHAIMPQRQEVMFLGTAGNRAVMADQCCGVRGAMEQPAGIFTIDGATGAISQERYVEELRAVPWQ